MKRLVLPDVSEQLVANALHAYAAMLDGALVAAQARGQHSREYERLRNLIRDDEHGLAARLKAPQPVNPKWEDITPPPPPEPNNDMRTTDTDPF